MEKKALMVISFGTTYPTARKAIEQMEQAIAKAYLEYDFYRAFTSGMVIRKIQREEGIDIPTPAQCMEMLIAQGYTHVICQSLHIIPGVEYEKMCAQLKKFETQLQSLVIGTPLLYDLEDYQACYEILQSKIPALSPHEAFVYMGHGSEHFSNAAYALMENTFRVSGVERLYIATVEGLPDFSYIQNRLQKAGVQKVHLAPFMLVAGDHAQNDMAGEEEGSWKTMLEQAGYEVQIHLYGFGEILEFASIFTRHLQKALQKQNR